MESQRADDRFYLIGRKAVRFWWTGIVGTVAIIIMSQFTCNEICHIHDNEV